MALDVGEPLFGTALAGVTRWLLIEHDGPWAPDAIDSPDLPAHLVTAARGWLAAGQGRRLQLIRRPRNVDGESQRGSGRRRLFKVEAGEGREAIVTAFVDDAVWSNDEGGLDHHGASGIDHTPQWEEYDGRLVLVCTHGRRDVCCARLGVPIYQALVDECREDTLDIVWQTSHVGGHRFAANIVMLPHGYHYGRLDAPVARRIVRGYLRGRLTDLDRMRGRSSYACEVQAAEYWYRQASGQCAVDGVRLVHVQETESSGFGVTLRDAASDEVHELWVSRELLDDEAPASCGDVARPVTRHHLESLRRLAGAETRVAGVE